MPAPTLEDIVVPLGEDFADIRESVRRICAGFPGAYWRELEERKRLSDRIRQGADRGRLPRPR